MAVFRLGSIGILGCIDDGLAVERFSDRNDGGCTRVDVFSDRLFAKCFVLSVEFVLIKFMLCIICGPFSFFFWLKYGNSIVA